jgi:hypothetical protein
MAKFSPFLTQSAQGLLSKPLKLLGMEMPGYAGKSPVGTTNFAFNLLIFLHLFSNHSETFRFFSCLQDRLAVLTGQIRHEAVILFQGHHRALVPQHAGHPVDVLPGLISLCGYF